jgi:hypothetical protein
MQLVFSVLGCIGLLRHLLKFRYPWFVWLTFAVLAAMALAWFLQLVLILRGDES